MYQKICTKISRPDWMKRDRRYVRLDCFDLLLDGEFYDHLPSAFFDEMNSSNEPISLEDRRPSAQFKLCRWVARWTARKIFAGRHQPRLVHTDKEAAVKIRKLANSSKLWRTMLETAFCGAVGSVAVTFRVDRPSEGEPSVHFSIWRAKYCVPSFDEAGNLSALRLQYQTTYGQLKQMGAPGIEPGKKYWFVRDYLPDAEVTYNPVEVKDWNPVDGFHEDGKSFVPWEDESKKHNLGFVPGHWFVNLAGGKAPDGACTFEDAIPNSIELDYNLSQLGRGSRYNSTPQLVVIGELRNAQVVRGPMQYLHLEAEQKGEEGESQTGRGDAKLLEMGGAGMDAALRLLEFLRNLALEQISASRKDPEKMRGPLSGRAMEFLEEDCADLVSELRTQFGEFGMLPLLKKAIRALKMDVDEAGIALQWPRTFALTAIDLSQILAPMTAAVTPLPKAGPQGSVGPDGAVQPEELGEPFLDPVRMREWLYQQMDLNSTEDPDGLEEAPDTAHATDTVSDAPEPIVPTAEDDTGGDAPVSGSEANVPEGGALQTEIGTMFGMGMGGNVRVDA